MASRNSDRPSTTDIPPADPRDKITITRDGAGYRLAGTYGAARILTRRDPLTAEHAAQHLAAFPRAAVDTSQLHPADAILGVLVEDSAGDQRPYSAQDLAERTERTDGDDLCDVVDAVHLPPAVAR